MRPDDDEPVILVLAPVWWGIPDDPFDTIPCTHCGLTCWMSRPAHMLYQENSDAELCCAPCYQQRYAEEAKPEDVLDIKTRKPLHPEVREWIETATKERMNP